MQGKCELHTTPVPTDISEQELENTCNEVSDVYASQPGLEKLDNAPLKLIVMKGPSEYKQRDFIFASLRPAETETGVWATLHPSYDELINQYNTQDKFSFLGYVSCSS